MAYERLGFNSIEKLDFAEVWQNTENGILMIDFVPYAEIGLEEAKIAEQNLLKFKGKDEKLLGITKLNEGTGMDQAAREHFAKCPLTVKHTLKLAAVFDNLAHRILYNFYLRINKPGIPMKGFENVENAVN